MSGAEFLRGPILLQCGNTTTSISFRSHTTDVTGVQINDHERDICTALKDINKDTTQLDADNLDFILQHSYRKGGESGRAYRKRAL